MLIVNCTPLSGKDGRRGGRERNEGGMIRRQRKARKGLEGGREGGVGGNGERERELKKTRRTLVVRRERKR